MTRNTEQGPGGVDSGTRKTTSHLDQAPGAGHKGPAIPQKGAGIPANLDGQDSKSTGNNLTPHRALTHQPSSVRGGGTVTGHDRVNPKSAHTGSKDKVAKELSNPGQKQHVPTLKEFGG